MQLSEKLKQHRDQWVLLLILVLFFVTFYDITELEFINFDDPTYVYKNDKVLAGLNWKSIQWAFTTFENGNWHPVTWLSHMAGVSLFGLNPAGHHLINLLFHFGNTLLVYHLLSLWSKAFQRSLLVALLFGLHPLFMESVAWISERKDVLSVFFFFLTLHFYTRYAQKKRITDYLLTGVMLIFGLMSKSMLVTTPFVLMLLDFWPLNRFRTNTALMNNNQTDYYETTIWKSISEKIPFFVIIFIFCIIAYIAQTKSEAIMSMESLSLWIRFLNSFISYGHYITHLLYPHKLSIFYPHPRSDIDIVSGIIWFIFILTPSAAAVYLIKKKPYLFFGWFYFIGTLVPVIGIVQIGSQAYANRYAYLPAVGFFIILSWGLRDIFHELQIRRIFALLIASIVLILVPSTKLEMRNWINNATIYVQALKNTNNNGLAHNNLGAFFLKLKMYRAAALHFEAVVKLHPNDPVFQKNLGLTYFRLNFYNDAIIHLEKCISLKKDDSTPYLVSAIIFFQLKRPDKARTYLDKGIKFLKDKPSDFNFAGTALLFLGERKKAVSYFEKAYRGCSNSETYQLNYLKALIINGDFQKAEMILKSLPENVETEKLMRIISRE